MDMYFSFLSDFIVPFIIFLIVCHGLLMKVPVYDTFVKGAQKRVPDSNTDPADPDRPDDRGGDPPRLRVS